MYHTYIYLPVCGWAKEVAREISNTAIIWLITNVQHGNVASVMTTILPIIPEDWAEFFLLLSL